MKACCTGWSVSPLANPSMVVMSWPTASRTNVVHAHTGVPSVHPVQAEHEPRSHPTLVPLMPSSNRSTSASVCRGSTATRCSTPLTRRLTFTAPGPTTDGPIAGAFAGSQDSRTGTAAAVAPMLRKRFLRPKRLFSRLSSLIGLLRARVPLVHAGHEVLVEGARPVVRGFPVPVGSRARVVDVLGPGADDL